MEAGLWLLLVGSAFGLMAWAFVTSSTKGHTGGTSLFQIIAGALFFILYITGTTGEGVAATQTVTGAEGCVDNTCTTNITLIPTGETALFVAYVFMALGIFNFVIIVRHFWEGT